MLLQKVLCCSFFVLPCFCPSPFSPRLLQTFLHVPVPICARSRTTMRNLPFLRAPLVTKLKLFDLRSSQSKRVRLLKLKLGGLKPVNTTCRYHMQILGTVGRYRMQEHALLTVGEVPKTKRCTQVEHIDLTRHRPG